MKKFLRVILATFLAVCLFGLTACGEASGEIKGNYKELDNETFNKIVEDMTYDNFFGSTDNVEIGSEMKLLLNANIKKVDASTKEEKDAISAELNVEGKFSIKDEGEKNNIGAALNLELNAKIASDIMQVISEEKYKEDVDAKIKGDIYLNNSGVYLDYSTEGIADVVKTFVSETDFEEIKGVFDGGKYSVVTEEIGEAVNEIDLKSAIDELYKDAKETLETDKPTEDDFNELVKMINEFGFDLSVDFGKGLKIKLSGNDKIEKNINEEIGNIVKFENVNLEIFLSLDKNYQLEAIACNVNFDINVSSLGIKGNIELKVNEEFDDVNVSFPDFKDYEDLLAKIGGIEI